MTFQLRFPYLLLPLLLTLACSNESNPNESGADDDDESETTGINVTTTGATDSDSMTMGATNSETATDSDTDSGAGSTSGFLPDFQCSRVDFIFVVDNSLSMTDEQQQLAQGVPGFVQAMQNTLPITQGFRVGVIDTDSYPALGTEETPLEGCPDDGSADCASCDYTLGAFLTKPTSATDPTLSCDFSTEVAYMDGQSETFANEFGCAALVGAQGNPIEQQAGSLVAAVSDDMNTTCNDDFIRDQALLVFLVISDEEDNVNNTPAGSGGSLGTPEQWYDAIVAAKSNRPDNVVALGLLGGSPRFEDCEELSQGVDGAEQSSRLVNFVERFPTHFVGSVCSDNYGAFFEDALDAVAEGCRNFIP